MNEREIRYYNGEQQRQQYHIPRVPGVDTFSEVLKKKEKDKEALNMAENDKDARIKRKFDTMIDMMSQLLGRMEQTHHTQQPEPQQTNNSGEDSGSGNHNEVEGRDRTANQRDAYTRGSVTRPLFLLSLHVKNNCRLLPLYLMLMKLGKHIWSILLCLLT